MGPFHTAGPVWTGAYPRLAAASGLWLVLTGHSPYRQWDIYRKVRLVVLVDAEDAVSVQLGQEIAGLLAVHLPESRAMMARARAINDVVRLLAEQATRHRADARRRRVRGIRRFRPICRHWKGAAARATAQLGEYSSYVATIFPKPNGYQIVETIAEQWRAIDAGARRWSTISQTAIVDAHSDSLRRTRVLRGPYSRPAINPSQELNPRHRRRACLHNNDSSAARGLRVAGHPHVREHGANQVQAVIDVPADQELLGPAPLELDSLGVTCSPPRAGRLHRFSAGRPWPARSRILPSTPGAADEAGVSARACR